MKAAAAFKLASPKEPQGPSALEEIHSLAVQARIRDKGIDPGLIFAIIEKMAPQGPKAIPYTPPERHNCMFGDYP